MAKSKKKKTTSKKKVTKKQDPKTNKMKTVLLVYTLVLLFLSTLFLKYVYSSLILYQQSELDTFIVAKIKDSTIAKHYKGELKPNKYEKEKVNYKTVDKLLKQKNIKTIKKSDEYPKATYDIYLDKKVIANVTIELESSFKRLFILNINKWKVKSVDFNFDNGFYQYQIDTPFNYTLYINDILVDDYELSSDKLLERVFEYDTKIARKSYNLSNFVTEPEIVIKDEKGAAVEFKNTDGKITIQDNYPKVEYKDLKLKGDLDIIKFAENWSLFLSNDLGGSRNGLTKFLPYLIDGSYMHKIATRWAKGPEIYDFSPHKAKGFQNEKIESCTIYSENSFSCEVKLEKIIVMTKTGTKRIDKMHENLFFTYYAGGYKLTDMQSA